MTPEDYRDTFWAMLRDAIDQVALLLLTMASCSRIHGFYVFLMLIILLRCSLIHLAPTNQSPMNRCTVLCTSELKKKGSLICWKPKTVHPQVCVQAVQ